MSISLQLYEDSGPVDINKGTYRTLVDNIGLKADGTAETGNHYAFSPVVRQQSPDGLWTCSYKKYNFALINGTYPVASRVRIKITNGVNGSPPEGYDGESNMMGDDDWKKVRIYYKLTNTYEQPNDTYNGDMMLLQPGDTLLFPKLSTTGPQGTASYPQYLTANTTYYTQYLVLQLVAPYGFSIGNIGEVNIEWYVDEYEDGNI